MKSTRIIRGSIVIRHFEFLRIPVSQSKVHKKIKWYVKNFFRLAILGWLLVLDGFTRIP